MRLIPFALLFALPAAGQQSETSRQIDRNIAELERAAAAPVAAVTGPPVVAVGVGETVAFRLGTTGILTSAGRVGAEFFTATQARDVRGIDVTVTGVAAGTGHIVFVIGGKELAVEVTVGTDTPAGRPIAIPEIARPKPKPTPPVPPGPDPPVPPEPPVPPPPDPPTPPGPVAPTKLVVVVVEETADAVQTRGAFFADKTLADFMRAHGHLFRAVDKDVVGPDGKPPADVVRFLDKAKAAKLPTLFLVDPKGKTVYEGPVPKTAAELMTLLKKWGGE